MAGVVSTILAARSRRSALWHLSDAVVDGPNDTGLGRWIPTTSG